MPLDPPTDTSKAMSDRPQSKIDDTTIGIFLAFFIIMGIFILAWCWDLARPRPFFDKPMSFLQHRHSTHSEDEHQMQSLDASSAGTLPRTTQAQRLPAALTPYSIATPSLIPSPLNIFRRHREPVQSPGLSSTFHRGSIDAESHLSHPPRAWFSRFVPRLYRTSLSSSASGDSIRNSAFTDRLTSLGPQPLLYPRWQSHVPTVDELETRFAKGGLPHDDPLALPSLHDGHPSRDETSSSQQEDPTHLKGEALSEVLPTDDWRSRKSIDSSTHNDKYWRLEGTPPRQDRTLTSSTTTKYWAQSYNIIYNTAAALTPSFFRIQRHTISLDTSSSSQPEHAIPTQLRFKAKSKHFQPPPTPPKFIPKKPTPLNSSALQSSNLTISAPKLTPGSRRRIDSKYESIQRAGPDAVASGTDIGVGSLDALAEGVCEDGGSGPSAEGASSSGILYRDPRDEQPSSNGHSFKGRTKGKTRADPPPRVALPRLQTLQPTIFNPHQQQTQPTPKLNSGYETLHSAGANPGPSGGYITSPPLGPPPGPPLPGAAAASAESTISRMLMDLASPQNEPLSALGVRDGNIGSALGSPRVQAGESGGLNGDDGTAGSASDRAESGANAEKSRTQEGVSSRGDGTHERTDRFSRMSVVDEEVTSGSVRAAKVKKASKTSKPKTSTWKSNARGMNKEDEKHAINPTRRGAVSAASGSSVNPDPGCHRRNSGSGRLGIAEEEGVAGGEDARTEPDVKGKNKGEKRASEMSCFNRHPGERVKSP